MKNEFEINSLKEKALLYIDERDRADRLQKEVTALSSQLISRNKTFHHKTFSSQTILNEDILPKLPACATLLPVMIEINEFELGTGTFGSVVTGKLVGLELEVAIKRSKGFALITEGRICQSFSGHPNFLWYFGMMGNDIVMELVRIFDPISKKYRSSTLQYALSVKLNDDRIHWIDVSKQIVIGVNHMHHKKMLHNDLKENNILLQVVRGKMVPKISDFGKSTFLSGGKSYSLSEKQKEEYNIYHRNLAFELRNLNGFKQSELTDAYSVGRILKQIGYTMNVEVVKKVAAKLKVDNYKKRAKLSEIDFDIL